MEEKKMSKRKIWVIRATVAFLLLMGLLTLFSQTIMNYSLTRVSAQYPEYNTIMTSVKSSATLEAVTKSEVKAFADREIEFVYFYDMQEVKAGDLLLTVKPADENEELEQLKKQLEELELAEYYEGKLPSNKPDYTTMELAIEDAKLALSEAKTSLSNAQNKNAIISTARANLSSAQADVLRLEAELVPLAELLTDMEGEQLTTLTDERGAIATDLEIATATLNDLLARQAAATDVPATDPTDPTDPAAPTDEEIALARAEVDRLQAELDAKDAQITKLNSDIDATRATMSSKSNQIVAKQKVVEDSNATLAEAEQYPTVDQAQRNVLLAEISFAQAEKALSDQKKIDGVDAEKDQYTDAQTQKQMDDLRKKIETLEELSIKTDIVAPIDGVLTNFNWTPGAKLTKDQVVATIVDQNGGFKADFVFSAADVQNFYIGMELNSTSIYDGTIRVTGIRPDPNNPRDSRIVSTSVEAEYLFEGILIEVNANVQSGNYSLVVPNSAIHEDNTGSFVYILKSKRGPLGERYTAVKVSVTVLQTDGKRSSIEEGSIQSESIITRSEKPLKNGEQVRLEDYQQEV